MHLLYCFRISASTKYESLYYHKPILQIHKPAELFHTHKPIHQFKETTDIDADCVFLWTDSTVNANFSYLVKRYII